MTTNNDSKANKTHTKIEKDTSGKRILSVDADITLAFKTSLHGYYDDKRRFEVYAYNDLLLTDVCMPASWLTKSDHTGETKIGI